MNQPLNKSQVCWRIFTTTNQSQQLRLQFSGGEPTIRNELFDFIRKAKEVGFKHVEVNTNGVRLAADPEYAKKLKEAGVSTVYLQFDGLTADVYKFIRGLDLLETKMKAIENLRAAGFTSIVLVVTLVKGVNDSQLGDIIKFAAKNNDIIRCVNVQPVSLCGRLPPQEREKMRITIPDFMRLVEEQTEGDIKASDFYPVPVVVPVSKAVGDTQRQTLCRIHSTPTLRHGNLRLHRRRQNNPNHTLWQHRKICCFPKRRLRGCSQKETRAKQNSDS